MAKLAPFRRYTDDQGRPLCQCDGWESDDRCEFHGPNSRQRRLDEVIAAFIGGGP